eukprot:jgi/Astpho2/7324/e_gw1.00113.78.1_t
MLNSCRSVDLFQRVNMVNEGTYGMVFRAKLKSDPKSFYALKKIKLAQEKHGFPLTSLREINILLSLHHANIVNVTEVLVGGRDDQDVFMVMEFLEHDLKGLLEQGRLKDFGPSDIKCLMQQLLSGVAYLHDNWVIHRDLKTSNILYSNKGYLKICDFGLARQFGDPLHPYTPTVVTLWYRAPEVLLGAKGEYSTAIDMWSVGCIMAELITGKPLFASKGELDCIQRIFGMVGAPTKQNWPGVEKLDNWQKFNFNRGENKLRDTVSAAKIQGGPLAELVPSEQGMLLLEGLLTLDPAQRLTAEQALHHPWFDEQPQAKAKHLMPTFPIKSSTGQGSHHHRQH